MMRPGPKTTDQLARLKREWDQGQHILITGPTGGGKTVLARKVVQQRIERNGHVIVAVGKIGEDPTIPKEYQGWTRWTKWNKRPRVWEKNILLWPDTDKVRSIKGKRQLQRSVFTEAFDELSNIGLYTLQLDEGLYTCSPTFLDMSDEVALLHQQGRSSGLSIVTLAQRPAHLPLVTYTSAAHAFVGRARETADQKRLAEMGSKENSKALMGRIGSQGFHDFTWIPVVTDKESEPLNLKL